ncbi:MAG: hypothetical protein ACR2JH_08650 [Solirubrobacteraceae bacterium]
MTVDEQLLYESRVRMRQAVIAALAGILLVGAAALQLSGPHTKVDELTLDLITAHKRFPIDVFGAAINGVGLCALAATLVFLVEITRARNSEVRPFMRWLAIVGGVLAALSGIVYAIVIAGKADTFVSHGSQTYEQANHLTSSGGLLVLPFIGQAAALLLAVGFVLIALQAMRVGLLTRFMGYLGIFTGVLVLFPIGSPVPVVQGFWLLALAYLFSGRWPNGVPPAWRSGQAEKWPSSAELREQRTRAAGGGGRSKPSPKPSHEVVGAPAAGRTRASTGKRKRKRRR